MSMRPSLHQTKLPTLLTMPRYYMLAKAALEFPTEGPNAEQGYSPFALRHMQ